MSQTYGLNQTIDSPRDAVVLEKYTSRSNDYGQLGRLLFYTTGTLVGGKLTVKVEIKPGAQVFIFPMTPATVSSTNTVEYDVANYPPSGTSEVLVAVFANQGDVKEGAQPH